MMVHWSSNKQRLVYKIFEESYHLRFYPHIEVDIEKEKKNRQKQNEETRCIIPRQRKFKSKCMYICINENHWLLCLSAGKCLSLFPTKIIIARLTNILFIQLHITILDDHTASLSRAIIIITLNIQTHTHIYLNIILHIDLLLIDKKREDKYGHNER